MFESDDEDVDFGHAAPMNEYDLPPQIPQPRNQLPPFRQPPSRNLYSCIPDPDDDPFSGFQNHQLQTGFVITNEIPFQRHREFSFFVFNQHDRKIYGVPRALTTPKRNLKLNDEQKWRKKFDLEFGRKLDFILDDFSRIFKYSRGPSDIVPVEIVEGTGIFKVNCVFDTDLTTFFSQEFSLAKNDRKLEYHIPNLSYECMVSFDESAAIQQRVVMKIFKVLKPTADQSVVFSTPWLGDTSTAAFTDLDVEEAKNPANYKANVPGLRYSKSCVLHLLAENSTRIIFGSNFTNMPRIGEIFQMDYVHHPIDKINIVAAIIITKEQKTVSLLRENLENNADDYAFETELNVQEQKYGFYHDTVLGMISDTHKCLRYLPYNENIQFVNVRVKACLKEPAIFEIVGLTEASRDISRQIEPPSIKVADGMVYNLQDGKLFSKEYPTLDLRIHPSLISRFQFGQFVRGTFQLADPDNFFDNRYISRDVELVNTEHNKCLPINDSYCLFVMRITRIKYAAPPSKKMIKANPKLAETLQQAAYRNYNFYFGNMWESNCGGLIGGTKGRVSSNDDSAYVILETVMGRQCIFNYVSAYDQNRYPLDLERNASLNNHVQRILASAGEEEDDRLSISTFHESSSSCRTSPSRTDSRATSSSESSFSRASSRQSTATPMMDYQSARATPIAEYQSARATPIQGLPSSSTRGARPTNGSSYGEYSNAPPIQRSLPTSTTRSRANGQSPTPSVASERSLPPSSTWGNRATTSPSNGNHASRPLPPPASSSSNGSQSNGSQRPPHGRSSVASNYEAPIRRPPPSSSEPQPPPAGKSLLSNSTWGNRPPQPPAAASVMPPRPSTIISPTSRASSRSTIDSQHSNPPRRSNDSQSSQGSSIQDISSRTQQMAVREAPDNNGDVATLPLQLGRIRHQNLSLYEKKPENAEYMASVKKEMERITASLR